MTMRGHRPCSWGAVGLRRRRLTAVGRFAHDRLVTFLRGQFVNRVPTWSACCVSDEDGSSQSVRIGVLDQPSLRRLLSPCRSDVDGHRCGEAPG